jgi:hypothetical protein
MLTPISEAVYLWATCEKLLREGYERSRKVDSYQFWTESLLKWNHYEGLKNGQSTS